MKRTLKTICLLAVFAITSINMANAQFGIQAGYVNSKFNTDLPSFVAGKEHYNGFEIGATYDFQIQGGVFMNYGLLYTFGKNSYDYGTENFNFVTIENTAHYLNIPVRVGYKYPINNSFRVFAYAGPNFTFGLAGKTSGEIIGFTGDGKWYGEDSDLKRFDIKLGLGIGVEYNNFVLKGGYDWGLFNAYDSDNFYARRNQFNISIAYLFNLGY